jgi:hypothetical protein
VLARMRWEQRQWYVCKPRGVAAGAFSVEDMMRDGVRGVCDVLMSKYAGSTVMQVTSGSRVGDAVIPAVEYQVQLS